MICPKCGAENDDVNKYCVKCGYDLNNNNNNNLKKNLKITILSSIIPGGGYFYLGYCFTGVALFLLNVFLLFYYYESFIFHDIFMEEGISMLHPYQILILLMVIYILQIIGSARRNIRYNNGEIHINRSINVLKSMILSAIICGSGLGYLELYKRFVLDVTVFIILFLTSIILSVTMLYYFMWIWYAFVLIDTYFCANAKLMNKDIPKLFGLLKIE